MKIKVHAERNGYDNKWLKTLVPLMFVALNIIISKNMRLRLVGKKLACTLLGLQCLVTYLISPILW